MDQQLYDAKKDAYEGKRERRISRYKEKAGNAAKESQATFDSAFDQIKGIPPGQPIIVGHHSEKRHRNTLGKHDSKMRKGFEQEEKASYYAHKAEAAESNSNISSDDPDAVEKLKKKIEELEKRHKFHLKCNREWKKYQATKAAGNTYSMQLTDQEKEKMLADMKTYPDYQVKTQPYPSYVLTNTTAQIRTAKLRIKKLEEHNARNTKNYSYTPEGLPEITVIHDVVENRLKIIPPGKAKSFALGLPAIFKHYGFVWSPSNGCYQRKLLNSCYVQRCVLKEIKAAYEKDIKEGQ